MRAYDSKSYASKAATVSDSVVSINDFGFTERELDQANTAIVGCRNGGVMSRWSGGNDDPTTEVGHYIPPNGERTLSGNVDIRHVRFIRAARDDAVVTITLE